MKTLEEIKKENEMIVDFIVSIDDEERLCLLSYGDFLKRYFSFSKEEKIRLLYEFEELIETGKISPNYLLKEWKKIDFGRFIGSMIKTIETTFISEGRMKFTIEIRNKYQSTINSNISLNEKIISLSNLVKNYIQFYGLKQFDDDVLFNDIESELNHLKELQTQQMLTKVVEIAHNTHKELSEKEPKNPHPQIFVDTKDWELFKYWKDNATHVKADLCFIYWKMKGKGMYPITPSQYAFWLLDKLSFDLEDYWKQYDRVKAGRELAFELAKNKFK